MRVLHIIGKEMEEIKPKSGSSFEFIDGDVYVVDNGMDIHIWRGKDCSVDEQTVGAWVANKLDNSERGGEPSVYSYLQGEESNDFKKLVEFTVIDDDTPGFLRKAELDIVHYKLFRVYTKQETSQADEVFVEEVPITKSSLKSEDVFMMDGNGDLFLWIGKGANREEKFEGQKLMQKVDSTRSYLPIQYTIYEGEGGKSETGFYKFLEKAASAGPVISVEDERELAYKPEESKTAEEHKAETKDVDSRDKKDTSAKAKEQVEAQKMKAKKGFLSRLMFWRS